VLSRASAAGLESIIITGSCVRSTKAAMDLAHTATPLPLYFTAGCHPHNAKVILTRCNYSGQLHSGRRYSLRRMAPVSN
jgi:Tat protein secretion system quality control protein TatD with DNase activity